VEGTPKLDRNQNEPEMGVIKAVLPSKVEEYDSEDDDENQLETAKA